MTRSKFILNTLISSTVILLSVAISCSESIKKDFFSHGVLKSEAEMTDGKRNGHFKEYDEQGLLVLFSEYKDDTLNGSTTRYYSNGSIAQELNYYKGRLVADNFGFLPDGTVKQVLVFDSLGRLVDRTDFTDTGRIDSSNTIPIVYFNRDTFRLNDDVTVYAKLANVDTRKFYITKCIFTSGFDKNGNAVDTLFYAMERPKNWCTYSFKAKVDGRHSVRGTLVLEDSTREGVEQVYHTFESTFFVKTK